MGGPEAVERLSKLRGGGEGHRALRVLKTGWTREQRQEYFSWYQKAASYKGGHSFTGFIRNFKNEAIETLTAKEKEELRTILEARPAVPATTALKPRPFVRKWTTEELTPLVENGLHGRDFDRGRMLFGAASCFACHRFGNEGGAAGPDLTAVAGRFGIRDLLEAIVEPSKVIPDQYAGVIIETADGRTVVGRIVNLDGDDLRINTDMLDPDALAKVNQRRIESLKPSPVSMMPDGLLDTLKDDEVLDLVAFLLSRGERKNKMFR